MDTALHDALLPAWQHQSSPRRHSSCGVSHSGRRGTGHTGLRQTDSGRCRLEASASSDGKGVAGKGPSSSSAASSGRGSWRREDESRAESRAAAPERSARSSNGVKGSSRDGRGSSSSSSSSSSRDAPSPSPEGNGAAAAERDRRADAASSLAATAAAADAASSSAATAAAAAEKKSLLEKLEERKRLHQELMDKLKGMQPAGVAGAPVVPKPREPPPPPQPPSEARAAPAAPPPPAEKPSPQPQRSPGPAPRPGPEREPGRRPGEAPLTPQRTAPGEPPRTAEPRLDTRQPQQREAQREAQPAVQQVHLTPPLPGSQAPPEAVPPPPAGDNVMKVVLVGAECAPWSKTGGLGDVMGALPKAIARRGHRTMAVAPRYAEYAEGWETGVRVRMYVLGAEVEVGYFHGYIDGVDWVFVDHPCFHARQHDLYGGTRGDIQFRCALLCKAALEAPWHVPCGGVTYGDDNLCFIANDWHTALLPVYLQAHYRDYGKMTYTRSVFVIHNIAHQGRGPFAEVGRFEVSQHVAELFRMYDPIGGEHMNIMKAGLLCAHRIVAVSNGYAWECQTGEGGWGLDGILRDQHWKLRGIVNGIDTQEWNPATDPCLKGDGYANYDASTMAVNKQKCKEALQKELGLPVKPDVPLLAFIGRLDEQKGVDLIRDVHHWLMNEGAQLILLGSGRGDLENALRDMENSRWEQCRGWVGFNVQLAHRLTAGADMLLMPSRFEPCGLNQLYAMAYGTVPIVHAVGGLRETVRQFDPFGNQGTGWTFDKAEPWALQNAIGNAMYTYREFRKSFVEIQQRGMEQDLSWDRAAEQYEEVLVAAKYQW